MATGKTARGRGKNATRKRRDANFRKRSSALLIRVGKKHGLETLKDLADCLGITLRALWSWRSGKVPVDTEIVWNCEPIRADFFDGLADLARNARSLVAPRAPKRRGYVARRNRRNA